MVHLLVTTILAAGAAGFEVHSLDGASATGQIAEFNARELVLETDAGPATFALSKLAAVHSQSAVPAAALDATLVVVLSDGTRLPAAGYHVAEGQAQIETADGTKIEVPTRRIRWVRFAAPEDRPGKLTKQWMEITQTEAAGDLLVVRTAEALDYLEGVLRDVDDERCHFEIDDEVVPVPRRKVEGLVYVPSPGQKLPAALGTLVTTQGARLELASIELADGRLIVGTPAGTKHELPLEQAARFDFSSGKVAYLSDLEPESAEFTPLVGFQEPPAGLLDFYAYRRDISFDGEPLRLDGKNYTKGLSLASRTRLVYRLPERFRVFRATVGIDDAVRETGDVRVRITADGRSLWEADVSGSQVAEELELKIDGARRLEILVDYGEGLDVGDRLNLGQARVTK